MIYQEPELAKQSNMATSSSAICTTALVHKVAFTNGPASIKTSDYHERRKRSGRPEKRAMSTRCKRKG